MSAAFVLWACGSETAERAPVTVVVDDAGRPVSVDRPARRIVSLVPSVTDLLVALDATGRLVGRTDFDEHAAVRTVPSLGRTMEPSAEAVARLAPDLVVVAPTAAPNALVPQLDLLGIRAYLADERSIADILSTTRRIGRLLHDPIRADSAADAMAAALDRLRACYRTAAPPSVLFVLWHSPVRTVGGDTYISELLEVAGARNVFHDREAWPDVSMEEILRRDPDFLVVPVSGGDRPHAGHDLARSTDAVPTWLEARPGWSALTAVGEGRVVGVPSDLVSRPGPRVVEAARALGRGLHPQRSCP